MPAMKLAKPDLFHPRIVLAGCPQLNAGDGDDDGLVPALRQRGLSADWLSWDDPDTATADLVILRATWDYVDRLDEFLEWTRRVRNLLNPPDVVAWNIDKSYLLDLAGHDVPVVPTAVFQPGEQVMLPQADEVVVKPAVGAGSVGAQRFCEQADALAHAARLHETGRSVLVQPYAKRVERSGETALVFIGGQASHAFTKGAMLPPPGHLPELDTTGTFAVEKLAAAEPDFELWDVGFAALEAAAAQMGVAQSDFLYARADIIGGPEDPRLLELELVEPALGWLQLDEPTRQQQQRQFAVCVESALEHLGLGPIPQRGP